MGKDSKIEWCDHTFNPWRGCTKVSPGCAHCYAETLSRRNPALLGEWGPGKPRVQASEAMWLQPLKWAKEAREAARGKARGEHVRPKVFCASLADWLDDEAPIEWLGRLFNVIHVTPELDYLLLTKRPGNWGKRMDLVLERAPSTLAYNWRKHRMRPHNVWVGTTVEDQARADERIPLLLDIPAFRWFLSCEPLLELVRLPRVDFHCDLCGGTGILARWPKGTCHVCHGMGSIPAISTDPKYGGPKVPARRIEWIICGGESGPGARPMHPDWARSLRDQAAAAGVPFFFKQWGEWADEATETLLERGRWVEHNWPDGHRSYKTGKHDAGRLLDGREWNGRPAEWR